MLTNLTYKQKLVAYIVATSLFAVLATSVPVAINDISQTYDDLIEGSKVKAKLVGGMAAAGVYFEQQDAVKRALDASEVDDSILYVAAFRKSDLDDSLALMALRNPGEFDPPHQIDSFDTQVIAEQSYLDYVELTHPIELDGELIGYIQMKISLDAIKTGLNRTLFFLVSAISIAMLLALVLANLVKGSLTRPIETLTNLTKKVGETKNYQLRVDIEAKDEIGELAEQFNLMLAELALNDEDRQRKEQQIIDLNNELEEKVRVRTKELESSNTDLVSAIDNLKLTQQQLVEQEKMASLGSLVAGIAHEVNTPIGIGVTAASHQKDIIGTLKTSFESGQLTKQSFSTNIDGLSESSQIILSNLHRAAELIRSFKLVAVDQSSEQPRLFDLKEYSQDVVTSLKPKFKNRDIEMELKMEGVENIYSVPGVFSQILTNFIVNSLNHGYGESDSGHIKIHARFEEELLILDYWDDGKGLDPSIRANIFDPFVTTARGKGGSGLGTYIVYNHVTQTLKGQLLCLDDTPKGVHFQIRVPENQLKT